MAETKGGEGPPRSRLSAGWLSWCAAARWPQPVRSPRARRTRSSSMHGGRRTAGINAERW